MNRSRTLKASANALILLSVLALPIGLVAQTKVVAPKNPYSIDKDIQLGSQAAQEVERRLPLLNDPEVQRYVADVGRRLAEAIPREFQHSEFRYSYKVANVKDINAFALPGGFTYVNRGLIEAASNEGELAGVIAHEISHVALRHGTAQVAKAQKYQTLGAIAGIAGAVIGGVGNVAGQLGQMGVGAYFLRFSREYEKQADLLGARIMANAGYDPRDLANMFRTIERASGNSGGPQWMSSHPNPGNRYEYIVKEAELLRISRTSIDPRDFSEVRGRLRDLPTARSQGEISRSSGGRDPSGGRMPAPSGRVESPSPRFRTYSSGNLFSIAVPDNWRELPSGDSVTFAPEGGYGAVQDNFVFTHGTQVGVARVNGRNLRQATDEYLYSLSQGNRNLRRQSGYQSEGVAGREGLSIVLSNVSEVTGETESVTIYTALLRNGNLLYIIAVAPERDYRRYQRVFQNIVGGIQIND
ncbi:MAG: M48 family metallopeptidase [Blastocatellia bacterium]